MRLPALSIYGGDWLRDPVSSCSLAAQGLWFRLMLTMHDARPYGHLVGANGQALSAQQIARQCGCSVAEVKRLGGELEGVGIPGRTGDSSYDAIFRGSINGEDIDLSPLRIGVDGVIYSRRMVRDQRLRVIRRLSTVFGRPKVGRLTGQDPNQNADTRTRTGAGGRPANEDDSSGISPTREEGAGEGRALTPQQLAVKQVEDALEARTSRFLLPEPGRIAKWIATHGIEIVLATIASEGDKGNLDGRNGSYLHTCIESAARRGTGGGRTSASRPDPRGAERRRPVTLAGNDE